MSYEEYAGKKHSTPYVYHYKSSTQDLIFFGVRHTRNYQDTQFSNLFEKWSEFIMSDNRKKILLIEKIEVPVLKSDLEKSVKAYGEAGYGIFLAQSDFIPVAIGEPQKNEIVEDLLNTFTKEEILLFYICSDIKHWQLNTMDRTIDKFLSDQNIKYKISLSIPDLNVDKIYTKKLFENILGMNFDENDKLNLQQVTDPRNNNTILNRISRQQSLFRNLYIMNIIEKYWLEGYSLFVLYGAGHAYMQQKPLEDLVRNTVVL